MVKDEISGKSKKPHRGYAFIVYDRERDMKGISSLLPPFRGKFVLTEQLYIKIQMV